MDSRAHPVGQVKCRVHYAPAVVVPEAVVSVSRSGGYLNFFLDYSRLFLQALALYAHAPVVRRDVVTRSHAVSQVTEANLPL